MDAVESEQRGKASSAIGGRDGVFRAVLSKVVGLGGLLLPQDNSGGGMDIAARTLL